MTTKLLRGTSFMAATPNVRLYSCHASRPVSTKPYEHHCLHLSYSFISPPTIFRCQMLYILRQERSLGSAYMSSIAMKTSSAWMPINAFHKDRLKTLKWPKKCSGEFHGNGVLGIVYTCNQMALYSNPPRWCRYFLVNRALEWRLRRGGA